MNKEYYEMPELKAIKEDMDNFFDICDNLFPNKPL